MSTDRVREWFGGVDESGFREFMQNLISGVAEDWVVDVPPGPPGEIDVVLTRRDGQQKFVRLIQSEDSVGESGVEDAVAAADENDEGDVVIMTNTGYTDGARRRAQQYGVALIDADGLRRLVEDRGLELPVKLGLEERARGLVTDWPDELREEALDVIRFVDSLADFRVEFHENEYSTDVCFTEPRVRERQQPLVKARFADAAVSMVVLVRSEEGYTRIAELSLGADNDSRKIKERIRDEVGDRLGEA